VRVLAAEPPALELKQMPLLMPPPMLTTMATLESTLTKPPQMTPRVPATPRQPDLDASRSCHQLHQRLPVAATGSTGPPPPLPSGTSSAV